MNKTWTVVIVILALVVLGYGGYRLYHHYTWKPSPTPVAMTQTTMKPKPSETMMAAAAIKTENNAKLGILVTDPKGMTLYTFSKDKTGVSNCNGACAQLWPPYIAKSQTGTNSASITIVKRTDGSEQYAWKGMPLYYYMKDTKAGDTLGNGFGGLLTVVKQ
jgi:predicted lipoprotein with Yx(FWY)xxD motif